VIAGLTHTDREEVVTSLDRVRVEWCGWRRDVPSGVFAERHILNHQIKRDVALQFRGGDRRVEYERFVRRGRGVALNADGVIEQRAGVVAAEWPLVHMAEALGDV